MMGRLSALRAWTDIRRPTRHDLLYVVLGFVAYIAAVIAIGLAANLFHAEAATHGTIERIDGLDDTALALTFATVWLGVTAEEYVFRNLLQKLLYEWMDYKVAIGVTSAIFASLHIPAYGGLSTPTGQMALSLGVVFTGSVILGYAYWRTKNLTVAIGIHGLINTLALAATVL